MRMTQPCYARVQSGAATYSEGFVKCFLRVPQTVAQWFGKKSELKIFFFELCSPGRSLDLPPPAEPNDSLH